LQLPGEFLGYRTEKQKLKFRGRHRSFNSQQSIQRRELYGGEKPLHRRNSRALKNPFLYSAKD
jgi:hypothetical protein